MTFPSGTSGGGAACTRTCARPNALLPGTVRVQQRVLRGRVLFQMLSGRRRHRHHILLVRDRHGVTGAGLRPAVLRPVVVAAIGIGHRDSPFLSGRLVMPCRGPGKTTAWSRRLIREKPEKD